MYLINILLHFTRIKKPWKLLFLELSNFALDGPLPFIYAKTTFVSFIMTGHHWINYRHCLLVKCIFNN